MIQRSNTHLLCSADHRNHNSYKLRITNMKLDPLNFTKQQAVSACKTLQSLTCFNDELASCLLLNLNLLNEHERPPVYKSITGILYAPFFSTSHQSGDIVLIYFFCLRIVCMFNNFKCSDEERKGQQRSAT